LLIVKLPSNEEETCEKKRKQRFHFLWVRWFFIENVHSGADRKKPVWEKIIGIIYEKKVKDGKTVECRLTLPSRVVRKFNTLSFLFSQSIIIKLCKGSYFNGMKDCVFIARVLACVSIRMSIYRYYFVFCGFARNQ